MRVDLEKVPKQINLRLRSRESLMMEKIKLEIVLIIQAAEIKIFLA